MTQPVGANFDQAVRDAVMGIMEDPIAFPEVFKAWVTAWIEANPPTLPLGQIVGYAQQIQASRVHLAANQSVANNSQDTVLFDTVDYDYGSLWDATNHFLKIKIPGKYLIGGEAIFDANTTGIRYVVVKRGTGGAAPSSSIGDMTVNAASTAATQSNVAVVTSYDLAANDTLSLTVLQNSGGALNVIGDTRTSLWLVRVGP